MGLTAFPNGVSSFGVPVLGGIPLPSTQGNVYHVKPYSGNDGNTGDSPDRAFKTLTYALAACTANQNDIILLYAESNTSASTTDYQSTTLLWNKDFVHLIGVGAGPALSQRSRVAFISTYATASNLITVSANGCLFYNIEFFAGVASANPTGCMKITGVRNHFINCHIAGIGADLMDTAGAYSLWLYDAPENVFDLCVIGIDTIKRGSTSNAEILFTGTGNVGSSRIIFRKCLITGWCESAGNYLFISANQANALGGYLLLDDCVMINTACKTGGATMTQAMQIHASANAYVILHNTTIVGAGNVNAADTGLIMVGAGGVIPGVVGTATDVTDLGLALVTTNA
jgi:hypothetical protein